MVIPIQNSKTMKKSYIIPMTDFLHLEPENAVNIQVGSENTGDTWTNEKIFDDLGSEGAWILDDEE